MLRTFLKYKFACRDDKKYRRLGRKYGTSGWNVYRIFHGKRIRPHDYYILAQLYRDSQFDKEDRDS